MNFEQVVEPDTDATEDLRRCAVAPRVERQLKNYQVVQVITPALLKQRLGNLLQMWLPEISGA